MNHCDELSPSSIDGHNPGLALRSAVSRNILSIRILYQGLANAAGWSAARDRTRQVVQVLVGEAYGLLDPGARREMQGLSVYPAPVPAVGVDFLLRPVNPHDRQH